MSPWRSGRSDVPGTLGRVLRLGPGPRHRPSRVGGRTRRYSGRGSPSSAPGPRGVAGRLRGGPSRGRRSRS
ncbi:hypothetical protein ERB44_05710 [Micrococcus luteus]|nr:hypothetical protein ERB44_05485 [Micrococcus luteus]QCY44670.1 hypothetical protein ERB44_05710 [Micrococcus luteus]